MEKSTHETRNRTWSTHQLRLFKWKLWKTQTKIHIYLVAGSFRLWYQCIFRGKEYLDCNPRNKKMARFQLTLWINCLGKGNNSIWFEIHTHCKYILCSCRWAQQQRLFCEETWNLFVETGKFRKIFSAVYPILKWYCDIAYYQRWIEIGYWRWLL